MGCKQQGEISASTCHPPKMPLYTMYITRLSVNMRISLVLGAMAIWWTYTSVVMIKQAYFRPWRRKTFNLIHLTKLHTWHIKNIIFLLCIICTVAAVLSFFSQFDHNLHVLVAITFSLNCHFLPSKKYYLKKVENFSNGYKHISYKNLQVTNATVTSNLQVCMSASLLLLTVRMAYYSHKVSGK